MDEARKTNDSRELGDHSSISTFPYCTKPFLVQRQRWQHKQEYTYALRDVVSLKILSGCASDDDGSLPGTNNDGIRNILPCRWAMNRLDPDVRFGGRLNEIQRRGGDGLHRLWRGEMSLIRNDGDDQTG